MTIGDGLVEIGKAMAVCALPFAIAIMIGFIIGAIQINIRWPK